MEHDPFIDDVPIKMAIFHCYVSHNQRVILIDISRCPTLSMTGGCVLHLELVERQASAAASLLRSISLRFCAGHRNDPPLH